MQAIITVALSPTLNQIFHLDTLETGQRNEAENSRILPGGKGINIAVCLAEWGLPVIATGVLGMENAAPFTALLAAKGISNRFVLQEGSTRYTIKLVERKNGLATTIHQPGQAIQPQAYDACLRRIERLCLPGSLVVLSGRLPSGLPDNTYAHLGAKLARLSPRIVLDGPSEALMPIFSRHPLPFCVNSSTQALAKTIGIATPEIQDVLQTALHWHHQGVEQVVVWLKDQGALFVAERKAWLAQGPEVPMQGTVSADGALLAGWLAALHQRRNLEDAMKLALAFAAGKLGTLPPAMSAVRHLARAVRLTQLPA